jgi:hypothetical protein
MFLINTSTMASRPSISPSRCCAADVLAALFADLARFVFALLALAFNRVPDWQFFSWCVPPVCPVLLTGFFLGLAVARPNLPFDELRCNRLELKVKDDDLDWLTQEAKRRRLPRATLAYLMIMEALEQSRANLADKGLP